MKNRLLSPIAAVLVLVIFMTSCQAPKAIEYRDFKNFTVNKLGFSSSSIRMDIVYYNPNNFGLQLKRTDLDIYIGDSYLGHTVQEYQIAIPRRGEFSVPVSVDVDMKNLFKNALTSVFSDSILVKVTGSVKIGKADVYKSFAVSYAGMQKFTLF